MSTGEDKPGGSLYAHHGISPTLGADVFIAPGARVIGDVEIGAGSSVWFNTVIRGDVNYIRIGTGTNIQDGSVVHVTVGTHPTFIGSNITIGHRALLHGCTLEDGCFIGMQATVMDGAVVESGAMVAAGALVTPNKRVPAGQLWAGSPARFMRDLSPAEVAFMVESPLHYRQLAQEYLDR